MTSIVQGCIDIRIDEIVPCLKDTQTGEIKETVVFKIESRAYLKKFRKSNGWHINWNEIPKNVEVYALALKDDNTIQGLVGIKNDKDSHAVYLHWVCFISINSLLMKNEQKSYWRCIIMNGTKPRFMENRVIAPSYYEQPDPYINAPSCHVNLLELSRYAKQCGKKLIELTQEEVKNFSI